MFTAFRRLGVAARIGLLLALAITSLATATAPASASRMLPPAAQVGKLGVYVFDGDAVSKGALADALISVYNAEGVMILKGTTDINGMFGTELDAGMYTVSAAIMGYAPSKVNVKIAGGAGTMTQLGLKKVNVTGKMLLTVNEYSPERTFPIEGAMVLVYNQVGKIVAKGTTDVLGKYLATLPVGVYKLEISAPGYYTAYGIVNIDVSKPCVGTITLYRYLGN
jgi:hypothetical protein